MKKYLVIGLGLAIFAAPVLVEAHPGRTDSSGCHTCKTNCPNWGLDYGEYHCHASKGVPQPKEPVRSIRNESGRGTTVPAPEYKTPKSTPRPIPTQTQELPESRKPIEQRVEAPIRSQSAEVTPVPVPVQEEQIQVVEEQVRAEQPTLPAREKSRGFIFRFFGWLF